MSTPPREIRGARVIRYAGDPAWSEPWHDLEGKEEGVVSIGTTVVAIAVVDYGFDPDEDHYLLQLHVEGWASDDQPGDRLTAIRAFNEEVSALGLAEIPLLPPPWQDVNADAVVQRRLTTLLRQELGESHTHPWGVRCAATCPVCEGALCEVGRTDWAVINGLTWTGRQSESRRPRSEAWGTWEHVRGSVDRHTARPH